MFKVTCFLSVLLSLSNPLFCNQTWDWGKVKKEENDAGVWGPQ